MWVQRVCTMPIPGSAKVMDGPHQEVFGRNKVGVEDGNELAFRGLHPFRQRTRFIAFTIGAVMVGDGDAAGGVLLHQALGDGLGLVGRIVEQLDVKLFTRILQAANRFQQALNYVLLVKNRKLHRDPGQLRKVPSRFRGAIVSVLVIKIYQHIAVQTVRGQQDKNDKVRNQQRHVKGVGVVKAPKRGVEKMLANVLADAARGHEGGQSGKRN